MKKLQLRLKFSVESHFPKEMVIEKLQSYLGNDASKCEGWVSENNALLSLPEEKRHFWSPFLNLRFETEGQMTKIFGRFGPNPTVWTLFIFLYMLFSFIGIAGLMIGLTQVTLDHYPWGFWIIPLALIMILFEYYIAWVGQRIGNAQTEMLQNHLIMALELKNN